MNEDYIIEVIANVISDDFPEAKVLKNCSLIPQTGQRETLRTFAITSFY
jgi:hypothetical protein